MRHSFETGIVLLLLLLSSSVFSQEVTRVEAGLFSTDQIGRKKSADGAKRAIIRSAVNLSGKLRVTVSEDETASIIFRKQAKTDNRSRAIDYIDLISVELTVINEEIRVDLHAPNPAPWAKRAESGMITAQLKLPAGMELEIDAMYFDIVAEGPFESVSIPSSLGKLSISSVTKNLDIQTANRRIVLDNISGMISATTSNSTIVARYLSCTDGQSRIRNDGGDIDIRKVSGSVNIRNRFGRINLVDFEPTGSGSIIRGSSAPIILDVRSMSEGQLVVINRHEDIEISIPDTLSAFLSLAVDDDGEISASGFPFATDLVQDNRLNLMVGEGAVDISGSIRGKGNIYVRGIQGE